MVKIKRWLMAPVFPGDEIKTRRAVLLNSSLINFMTLIPLLIIGDLLSNKTPLYLYFISLLAFLICLLCYRWMQHGKLHLASLTLVSMGLLIITLTLANLGTIRSPTANLYLLMVITGGLLFDFNGMVIITILCSFLIALLIGAENAGMLPRPDYSLNIAQWFSYTALFGWVGSLTYSGLKEIRSALARADLENLELKHTEDALRKSEEKYRTLFEESFDGIFVTSTDGKVLDMNKMGIALLGYHSKEEIQKINLTQDVYLNPNERGLYLKKVNGLGTAEFETVIKRKNGEKITVYLIVSVVKDDSGMITSYRGIIHDITEKKKAEEEIKALNRELEQRVIERTARLEAANKELEAFSYSVSHDLRAPLRRIGGFVGILSEQINPILDQQNRHYMGLISKSVKHMGELIDDLLLFSKTEHSELRKTIIDLNQLLRIVIREIEVDVQGRNIHWQIGNIPPVAGDFNMLKMVLVNLVSNAVKFTSPRAQAEIEIGCDTSFEKEFILFVRDNGVGFDMDYAHKLFGVFQRLHKVDEFEGTGIGLANVRSIIERHGGRTWAEGKPNQGATFYFSLPKTDNP